MNPTHRQPIPRSPAQSFNENQIMQNWLAEIQEARRQSVIRHIRKQQFAHVFREDVPQVKKYT